MELFWSCSTLAVELTAFSLQVADLTHLRRLSEDLDTFDSGDLLALAKAS